MIHLVTAIYILAMTGILLYCMLQLSLAWQYMKQKRREKNISPPAAPREWPMVTVQLPLYNEKYVVERLIRAVCALDYPKDKLEIQLLDDSTDDTSAIIKEIIPLLQQQGVQIHHVQRVVRKDFKAGALQEGLRCLKGEYIAIFDADFIPSPDFLKRTVPYFSDKNTGVVQSRWQHINKDYSLLTMIQAFAIDVHFTIEQTGRNGAGYFINFNGTAGIWRKECIEDAGGWSADTLTEDLDLSYRAQLKGWKFKYLENLGSPAELPAEINGYKTQQYRWNKGGAETARKMIPRLMSSTIPGRVKLHGVAHLLNSSIYILVFTTILLSLPLLLLIEFSYSREIYMWLSIFLLALIATSIIFFLALYSTLGNRRKAFFQYSYLFPFFLMINMGMSLHNAWAVLKGLVGIKSSFIRTPKFNIINKSDSWSDKGYEISKLSPQIILEAMMVIYFFAGAAAGIYFQNLAMLPLHLMAGTGFFIVLFYSLKHHYQQKYAYRKKK